MSACWANLATSKHQLHLALKSSGADPSVSRKRLWERDRSEAALDLRMARGGDKERIEEIEEDADRCEGPD